jgi:sterol-4alpha-carboxylate 3-dehydrogenase (decarboxylating)
LYPPYGHIRVGALVPSQHFLTDSIICLVQETKTIVGAYDSWKRGRTHVQLGNNKNLTDKTYVGNVAHAILLALDKLSDPSDADQVAGQTFFITNNDPRFFWDFMRSLWAGFDTIFPDRAREQRSPVVIPRVFALVLAYVMQLVAWLKGDKSQLLTPYTVSFATATMYFNSAKAARVLGYEPQVSVDEGIKRTMAVGLALVFYSKRH